MKAQMYNISFWTKETDPCKLKNEYTALLADSGFGVLNVCEHYFKPYGYTALFLLSESHLAIHTFPEQNQSYIELTSCISLPYFSFIKKCNTETINHIRKRK